MRPVSPAELGRAARPLPPRAEPVPAPRRTTSAALLGGGRKLLIEHDGEVYTLQLTRQNKLLLTK